MKILLLILLLISLDVNAQNTITPTGNKTQVIVNLGGGLNDSMFAVPYRDTTQIYNSSNSIYNGRYVGRFTVRPQDSLLYYHNGKKWISIGRIDITALHTSDTCYLCIIATNYRLDSISNTKISYTDTCSVCIIVTNNRLDSLLTLLVPKTTTVNGYRLNSNITITQSDIGLQNVNNTFDINKPVSIPQQDSLNNVVKYRDTPIIATSSSVISTINSYPASVINSAEIAAWNTLLGQSFVVPYTYTISRLTGYLETTYTNTLLIGDSIISISLNGITLMSSSRSDGYSYVASTGTITWNTAQALNTECIITYINPNGIVATSAVYTKAQLAQQGVSVPNILFTLISSPVSSSICTYHNTTSIFSGWRFNILWVNGANCIVYQARSRSTTITQIAHAVWIKTSSGTIVHTDTSNVNIPPTTVFTDTIKLSNAEIANITNDTLQVFYACNQLVDNFSASNPTNYPNPPFAQNGYQTGGNLAITGLNNSSSQFDFWYQLIYDTTIIQPNTFYAEEIASKSTTIQSINSKMNSIYLNVITLIDSGIYIKSIVPSFNSTTYPYRVINDNRAFYGYATYCGNPGKIIGVKFPLRAASTNILPITIATLSIMDSTATGSLIATKTVDIPPLYGGQVDTVLFNFYDTLTFTHGVFVSISTNDSMSVLAVQGASGTIPYPYPTYPVTYFGISHTGLSNPSTDGSNWSAISSPTSSQINMYLTFLGGYQGGVISNDGIIDIQNRISIPIQFQPYATIDLPSTIPTTEGIETNLYWGDFINSNIPISDLNFSIVCIKGQQQERGWRYTPVASDSGSTTFQLNVWYAGNIISSKTLTLYTSKATTGTGKTLNWLSQGDSQTADALWQTILHGLLNPTVTLVGSQGTFPIKNEGYSGYGWSNFGTNGGIVYEFIVSGVVSVPNRGDHYTNNGCTFVIDGSNITGGSGDIEGTIVSGTSPTASGTLTRTFGSADATIAFSSQTSTPGNPYFNISSGMVDIANFLSTKGITLNAGTDIWSIMLGTNGNGYTGGTPVTQLLDSTTVNYVDTMIVAIHRALSGMKIVLMLPPSGSDYQSAFGVSYASNGLQAFVFRSQILHYDSLIIANFDDSVHKTNGVYVIGTNGLVDGLYNYPHAKNQANAYNTTDSVIYGTNGVHLLQSGYSQLGTGTSAILKYFLK